jgi:type I restriction enzyme M protein
MVGAGRRFAFGLPRTDNANYLWIQLFYSALNARGRAGFVMASSASDAGNKDKDIRQQLVNTGHVDVMVAIRSNFFYTRTVPCELWHFDRYKPAERKDQVLMLDARNVYRKVTRKIYDFSPEQQANLSAIVWLYRGQQSRYLGLVGQYLNRLATEAAAVDATLAPLLDQLTQSQLPLETFSQAASTLKNAPPEAQAALQSLQAALTEQTEAAQADGTLRTGTGHDPWKGCAPGSPAMACP